MVVIFSHDRCQICCLHRAAGSTKAASSSGDDMLALAFNDHRPMTTLPRDAIRSPSDNVNSH